VKVFIISDIEGVAGIVKGQQTGPGPHGDDTLFAEGRKLYTEEINAAVRGAKAAGATEIVVMDCHGAGKGWTFNSLVPDDLDPDCQFVVQDSGRSTRSSWRPAAMQRSSSVCTLAPARETVS
jgi:D-amino peptidase